ncbi:MAG: hypothetical protein H7178_12525 [Chitinophagaceae bacterium]|nr:hypothetical protein [Chitinophagaceae bacterium]
MNDTIKLGIEKEAGIELPEDWMQPFVAHINHLVDADFEKLIYLLYRIDVSEHKIKQLLESKSEATAGELIAHAIIERQQEKIVSRNAFKQDTNMGEEDKW